jgi:nicotinate-nucleotide pyrophosphorylase (carboxylating)
MSVYQRPLPKGLAYLNEDIVAKFIDQALREDVGEGDHSSLASISASHQSGAVLKVKDNGILAGVALAERIFHHVDPDLKMSDAMEDGAAIEKGMVAFVVRGSAQSITSAERLVLNCMQRMSAIATYTHKLQNMINHTNCKILDTRKTTPNFRICEKWAVSIGGGVNHRFGLYDMIMLKDNHVDYAGGIGAAIRATQDYQRSKGLNLKVEIETRNLNELSEVLRVGGVDRIMLDNYDLTDLAQAVKMIAGKYETEASGGITESTIVQVAETGVDFISIGALTHSVKSLDLSLKAI